MVKNLIADPATRDLGRQLQSAQIWGLTNKETVPAQMTPDQLADAIGRNSPIGMLLSGGGAVAPNPVGGLALGQYGQMFADKVEQMKAEWERKTGREWPKIP